MPTGPSEWISRYSRVMSWAVGSTWWSGGRRRAQARPSASSTRKVRLDRPPATRVKVSGGRNSGSWAAIHSVTCCSLMPSGAPDTGPDANRWAAGPSGRLAAPPGRLPDDGTQAGTTITLGAAMDVTDQTFQEEVLTRSATVPVVVDLWAPWCGPCKTLGPMLEKAVADTDGAVELAKVNVDDNPRVAQTFAVQSIPAVFAISNGQVVDQFIGAVPEAQVTAFVQRLAPAPSEADTLVGRRATRRRCARRSSSSRTTPAPSRRWPGCSSTAATPPRRSPCSAGFPRPRRPGVLAAEARLLEAGVDVSDTGRDEIEAKLDDLLERVRDDDAARQEFVDLLEALGRRRPAHQRVPARAGGAAVLMALGAAGTHAGAQPDTAAPRTANVANARVLDLGGRRYDLTHRALVMGILNRTPDSFYDKGATFELDKLYARAEQLVADGADILDIGGVKAGPGPEVTEAEELDRVVPVDRRPGRPLRRAGLRRHLARLGRPCLLRRGRRDGQRHQRPGRPRLRCRRRPSTVRRSSSPTSASRPASPTPTRTTTTSSPTWRTFLTERAGRARAAGVPAERIVLDAGLDLGKTAEQSLTLLRASRAAGRARAIPLLLSASNKTFLGKVLDLEITERGAASIGAAALGIAWGCRIVRVHDVLGTCRARDALAAVSEAP